MPNTLGRIQKFGAVGVGIHLGEPAVEDVLASDVLDVLLENPDVNILTDAEYALLSEFVAISGANDDFMQIKAGVWTNRTVAQVKVDLGITNVDNTSDINKPVSTAQQIAIDAKVVNNLTASSTVAPSKDAVNIGLGLKLDSSEKGSANGVAPLDGSSKIPTIYLPALAISDTFVVASQVAMLALTAQTGDVAVRTDLSKSFILAGTNPTVLGDWQELLTPVSSVISVNSQTGIVSLTTNDIPDFVNKRYVTDAQLVVLGNTSSTNSGDNAVNSLYSGLATSKQDVDAQLTDIAGISFVAGDILYFNGTNIVKLGIGTAGQVLKVTAGLPSWGAGGGGSGRSDANTTTVNASAGASVDMITSKNVEVIMDTNVVGLTCPVDPTQEGTPLVLTVTMGATPYTMTLGAKFEGGLDNPIPSPFLDTTINKSGIYHFAWNRVNAKWTFVGMERKRG